MMSDEGERWFAIEMQRKREKRQRTDRARRRAQKAAQREQALQRVFSGTTPKLKMQVTEWETDAQGNLSRKIYAES